MVEPPPLPKIPHAVLDAPRRGVLPFIWLLPLLAIAVGGWLAVRSFVNQGPTITIAFRTAEGLEAGKTKIRYKEVEIGVVKSIVLSADHKGVIATAELTQQADELLASDTRFWVVRARIAGGQISGLTTLLSGSYIGVDPGSANERRDAFVGLDEAPAVTGEALGRQFMLQAENLGSIEVGAPVYFRNAQVGQVVASELAKDGKGAKFRIFVDAPYDRYVSTATRFWNASGIDVTVDASGVRLRTESLLTILIGGISFQQAGESKAPLAAPNTEFTLFPSRDAALKQPDTEVQTYQLVFEQTVRGLSVGAPVDFRGVVLGEVTRIDVTYAESSRKFVQPVEINVYPARIHTQEQGLAPTHAVATFDSSEMVAGFIANGLRGQLRTGNPLTGQTYVALDFFPDATPVTLDQTRQPMVIPTVPGTLDALQAQLSNIAKKLDHVAFDQLDTELRRTLQTVDVTLHTMNSLLQRMNTDLAPVLLATMKESRRTLASANSTLVTAARTLATTDHLLASDSPLQQELHTTLRELARAAATTRNLTDYLERHPEALLRGKAKDAE